MIDVCYVYGEVEDVKHFLVRCDEFGWERQRLLERIYRSDGRNTRVFRGVLEGRGRRKDGFVAGKEHRGRCGSYGRSAEVVAEFEAEGAGIWWKSLLT